MEDIVELIDIPIDEDDITTIVPKLFDIMHPLIYDIYDQFSSLFEVVETSSQEYGNYMQLLPKGLVSIGALGAEMQRESSGKSDECREIKRIFWKFLMEQLRVRSEVLQATAETLNKHGGGDPNYSLSAQVYEIWRLQQLIKYFDEWGTPALPEQKCDQLLT